jgi:hypothetical protein
LRSSAEDVVHDGRTAADRGHDHVPLDGLGDVGGLVAHGVGDVLDRDAVAAHDRYRGVSAFVRCAEAAIAAAAASRSPLAALRALAFALRALSCGVSAAWPGPSGASWHARALALPWCTTQCDRLGYSRRHSMHD